VNVCVCVCVCVRALTHMHIHWFLSVVLSSIVLGSDLIPEIGGAGAARSVAHAERHVCWTFSAGTGVGIMINIRQMSTFSSKYVQDNDL
jgi:hypothetical protein